MTAHTKLATKTSNKVTHVKSCSMTRAGLNGISTDMSRERDQSKMFSTSFRWTWNSSQFRTADSNKIRTEYGSLSEMQTKQHCFYAVSHEQQHWFLYITTTTVSQPFFREHLGKPVPEENFWTLWCKGRLTEADTSTIRLGATPSGLTMPTSIIPHFL